MSILKPFSDPNILAPLLITAILALLGGIVIQAMSRRASLKHQRDSLLTAFHAELSVIRSDLASALSCYRRDLKEQRSPLPGQFLLSTPIFDSNATNLGQLRDTQLVEYLVTTYSSIHTLSKKAKIYQEIDTTGLPRYYFNNIHSYATSTHVQVIKLHKSLARRLGVTENSVQASEKESFEILKRDSMLLDAGRYEVIMERDWS